MSPADEAPGGQETPASAEATAHEDWQRRRRLAEVFGEVLPETTGDERAPGAGGPALDEPESATDAWLRAQVPPHHG